MKDFKAMSDLVADAEDLLGKLSDNASPQIRELRGKVQESVAEMKTHLRTKLKAGSDELEAMTDKAVELVKAYPWVAAAIATAVVAALAVGVFAAASKDSED